MIGAPDTHSRAVPVNHLFDEIRAAMPGPAAPCIETHDGRAFSYGDMMAASARFADALVACGVAPGDRVAAQIDKSVEALMLYLGTVRAGAIFLPLNPAYTASRTRLFLRGRRADAGRLRAGPRGRDRRDHGGAASRRSAAPARGR